MQDEILVSADSALAGMVARMTGAVVRRPGEREKVVIERARTLGVVAVMVMLGKGRGSEGKKGTKKN